MTRIAIPQETNSYDRNYVWLEFEPDQCGIIWDNCQGDTQRANDVKNFITSFSSSAVEIKKFTDKFVVTTKELVELYYKTTVKFIDLDNFAEHNPQTLTYVRSVEDLPKRLIIKHQSTWCKTVAELAPAGLESLNEYGFVLFSATRNHSPVVTFMTYEEIVADPDLEIVEEL